MVVLLLGLWLLLGCDNIRNVFSVLQYCFKVYLSKEGMSARILLLNLHQKVVS